MKDGDAAEKEIDLEGFDESRNVQALHRSYAKKRFYCYVHVKKLLCEC